MSHSFYRIWLHAVFSTKNRMPLIVPNIETEIFGYMRKQLIECGCPVGIINGMPDHVHILYLQNSKKSIADTVKQIKGATSHWINENDLTVNKFAWQTGYGVFSISESHVERVSNYIKNQKEHHKKATFSDEYDRLMKLYNQTKDKQENG